jgi:hypothetical protein
MALRLFMIICPVCRFEMQAVLKECPDCGAQQSADSNAVNQSLVFDGEVEGVSKPVPKLGDELLDRFTLTKSRKTSSTDLEFFADDSQGGVVRVSVLMRGSATQGMVLVKARAPLLRLAHPCIESYIAVEIDDHERCVIVTHPSQDPTISEVLKIAEFGDSERLNPGNLESFALDCCRLLELFHRRHCLPELSVRGWRVGEDGKPLLKGVMKARLKALELSKKEAELRKEEELRELGQCLIELCQKALACRGGALPKPLTEMIQVLQVLGEDKALTASRMLSALAQTQSQDFASRPEKGPPIRLLEDSLPNQRPAKQVVDIDRVSNLPTFASGAPINVPRKVVKGPHFVPKQLVKERHRVAMGVQRKMAASQGGPPKGSQLQQLRHDLMLMNGVAWIVPLFAATSPMKLIPAMLLGAFLLPFFSQLPNKKDVSPSGTFFLFLLLGVLLTGILGLGGGGLFLAMIMATASATRSKMTRQMALEDPYQKEDDLFTENLFVRRRAELEEYLNSGRTFIGGGLALLLAIIPAAAAMDFVYASGFQALIFGMFATYLGLKKGKNEGNGKKWIARNLIFAGLFCCWSFIRFPLPLISGLAMTIMMALGYGWLVEEGAMGAHDFPEQEPAQEVPPDPLPLNLNVRPVSSKKSQSLNAERGRLSEISQAPAPSSKSSHSPKSPQQVRPGS